MRRERERQMWEKEVEEELGLDQPVGPTHYQSVQEGEIRSHGVGYYQFSQEEEERKKQMDMLDKLRKEVNNRSPTNKFSLIKHWLVMLLHCNMY